MSQPTTETPPQSLQIARVERDAPGTYSDRLQLSHLPSIVHVNLTQVVHVRSQRGEVRTASLVVSFIDRHKGSIGFLYDPNLSKVQPGDLIWFGPPPVCRGEL